MAHQQSIQNVFAMLEKNPSKVMRLRTKTGKDIPLGEYAPRADMGESPDLFWKGPQGSYVFLKIDLDAPFPSFNVMSPILHFVGYDLSIGTEGGDLINQDNMKPLTPYRPPRPPPGSAPHRYLFLLFPQPDNFDSSDITNEAPISMWNCVRLDYDAFLKRAGLTAPVAATYVTSN